MDYPVDRARRVKIGIEHALRAAELDLQAVALADLECGRPELADEVVSGEANDRPVLLNDRGFGHRGGRCRRRPRGAGGEE